MASGCVVCPGYRPDPPGSFETKPNFIRGQVMLLLLLLLSGNKREYAINNKFRGGIATAKHDKLR